LDTSTQTIATFTGTLLRREHNPGQKFVQLVFREKDQDWLCISSKLVNVKLTIGQDYHIEGLFKQVGDRAYIHEPIIKVARRSKGSASNKKMLHRRPVLIGSAIAVAILVVGGTVFALQGSPDTLKAENASSQAPRQVISDTSASTTVPETPATDTTPPPETTPPPATTPTTPAPKKSSPAPSPTPVVTPPVTPPPPAVPDCDGVVITAFDHLTTIDDTQPAGTVVRQGIDGQTQACYPNGRGADPVINTIVQKVDELTTATTPVDAGP
jgi:hypothetical protein